MSVPLLLWLTLLAYLPLHLLELLNELVDHRLQLRVALSLRALVYNLGLAWRLSYSVNLGD